MGGMCLGGVMVCVLMFELMGFIVCNLGLQQVMVLTVNANNTHFTLYFARNLLYCCCSYCCCLLLILQFLNIDTYVRTNVWISGLILMRLNCLESIRLASMAMCSKQRLG